MLAEKIESKEQGPAKYAVMEDTFRDEEMRKKAYETVERIINELKELEDIETWLENVLEIRRVQSLLFTGEWNTEYYEFILSVGGPNIIVKTGGAIEYYWYSSMLVVKITDEEVLNKLEEIEELLNETLNF